MRILPSQITDEHRLIEVHTYNSSTRFWDDGYGPLWVYRCSIAVLGVVRARSGEDAYECAVDEIMDDGTYEDAIEGLTPEQIEQGELNEGYQYRNNGVPSNEGLDSPIASEDLNGSDLRQLTDELAEDLHISIFVEDEETETSGRIQLADDGTLDTVVRCSVCGAEGRYNYAGIEDDQRDELLDIAAKTYPDLTNTELSDRMQANAYAEFVAWAIEDFENEHECEEE